MTDISSCPCYTEGDYPDAHVNVGVPTNIGVGNCLYNQRGSPVFNESILPKKGIEENRYNLNTVQMATINPDFKKIECTDNSPCNDVVYIADDPRLMDTRRNSLLKLDRPPYRSTYFISNNRVAPQEYFSIYCPEYRNYGKHYKTYDDINAGQITYYTDPSISDPYFSPNFTIPSKVESVLYRDPMGSIKPTYVRKEVQAPNQCYNPLSFIRDSAVHREDILASQMAQMNQMRWGPRWKK